MKTLSLSEAKMKLSGLVESVSKTDEEIVITKNGRPAAVLVSPDEFESWKETVYVKSSQSLMADIQKGLKDIRKAKTYTLDKLLEEIS
jgi:antitoxin YefM